jgi:type IVB pilus formation R64 PilN family outer membrane protein
MKLKKRFPACLSAAVAVVLLQGCASLARINDTSDQAERDNDLALGHLSQLQAQRPVVKETPAQWINKTPIMENRPAAKAAPGCAITLNRQGSIAFNEITQRITSLCGVPVTVTPDALMAMGGVSGGKTEQISGSIPVPDTTGMVPLAAMGGDTTKPAVTGTGNTLNGLYWSGQLSGLLDTLSSRLGISWRYDQGRIFFYYLETRAFGIAFMDSKADFNAKVVSGTTSSVGNTGGSGGNSIAGDSSTSQSTTMEIKSSLYADLQESVKSMLTPLSGRMFLSAGVMTVTDTPQVLDTIGKFIEHRNRELNRQVVLNVEVLSVEKRNQDQAGIDWNAVFNSGSLGATLSNTFTSATASTMTGGLSIFDGKLAGSKAFIKALSEQARVSIVTQQASTTTNMSPLPMQVADQEDYAAQVSTSSTVNVGTSTSITPATITTGFNMTLLPYIMPDASSLQLQFSISLSDAPTRRTFTSGSSSVELLKTKLKTVNQRVNMKSGQTIVLSGFQQANRKSSRQGVGNARFFGLGGGQSGENNNQLLVILITPTILQQG